MGESSGRWESDPLFSAAEVVQDSADRMESVFRTLLHEQNLTQGDFPDSKLISLIQYHKRDLSTALETTKWQLEDFERAVNFAALSDKSSLRENAIVRHRQFIRAIRAQIDQVEKSVTSSISDFNKGSHWYLNEQDRNGLASFLSGDDSSDYHSNYDTGNSIMRRFLDSNTGTDEIIELKDEEGDPLQMNGPNHPEICTLGGTEQGSSNALSPDSDLEAVDSGTKCYAYRNRSRHSVWQSLRNFWLAYDNKRSFTKRRKDGEVTDYLLANVRGEMLPPILNKPPAEQISNKLRTARLNALLGALQKKGQRFQHNVLHNQSPIRLIAAVMALLALFGCHFAISQVIASSVLGTTSSTDDG